MVTNGNHSYGGKNFIMYIIAKSLCCTPKINIILYVNYTSNFKNITPRAKVDFITGPSH